MTDFGKFSAAVRLDHYGQANHRKHRLSSRIGSSSRVAFRSDNQRDDNLHAIGPFVAPVTVTAFVSFGKGRIAFAISAAQIVEQHVEFGPEEVLSTTAQMLEQWLPILEGQKQPFETFDQTGEFMANSHGIRREAQLDPPASDRVTPLLGGQFLEFVFIINGWSCMTFFRRLFQREYSVRSFLT